MEYPPRRASQSATPESALEQMPNLCKKISLMWPSRELDNFIQRAILDGRDGDRKGFPMEVGTELMFLGELNKLVRSIDLAGKSRIKLSEAYALIEKGDQEALSPAGNSPWLDPLSVGSSRISNIPQGRTSTSLLKAKPKKRGLIARLFSIR